MQATLFCRGSLGVMSLRLLIMILFMRYLGHDSELMLNLEMCSWLCKIFDVGGKVFSLQSAWPSYRSSLGLKLAISYFKISVGYKEIPEKLRSVAELKSQIVRVERATLQKRLLSLILLAEMNTARVALINLREKPAILALNRFVLCTL
jgi:hypothetical protein